MINNWEGEVVFCGHRACRIEEDGLGSGDQLAGELTHRPRRRTRMAPPFRAGLSFTRGVAGEVPIDMVRRTWFAAAFATIAGFGCHASPTPNAAKSEPPLTIADVTATKFIAAHNENARLITALKASPRFVLLGEHSEKEGRASGHLAFERSKNFRL